MQVTLASFLNGAVRIVAALDSFGLVESIAAELDENIQGITWSGTVTLRGQSYPVTDSLYISIAEDYRFDPNRISSLDYPTFSFGEVTM